MADNVAVPAAGSAPERALRSSQLRQWGSLRDLSSPTWWERALAERPFERMPWIAVALLAGCLFWFGLNSAPQWIVLIGLCGVISGLAMIAIPADHYPFLRAAVVSCALVLAAGTAMTWARSELIGARPIGRPMTGGMAFKVMERSDPVRDGDRTRLIVVTQGAGGAAIKARITLPEKWDNADIVEGVQASARLRLVPPSRAVVPGAYDPARRAWFDGISASGTVMSEVAVLRGVAGASGSGLRDNLARHVRAAVSKEGAKPTAAGIAATLLTGNRDGIERDDAQAMRDAGLAHLLSISGLHVGAVIAIVWFAAMRGLALWPWLALRIPIPLLASILAAGSGVGYTLLTGAALPTVRACLAALLVLTALTLGRQALSMRIVAIAAIAVLLFWPEAAISPSFQLSFAAVMAIVALHNSDPVARFRQRMRGEGAIRRIAVWAGLLFLTGLVIEIALFPLVLFHFHRAGIYGAAINLFAIPLTTFIILPVLMLASLFDLIGFGAPFWWLAGAAIELLLDMARAAAGAPGSVKLVPLVPRWIVGLTVSGGIWLALWSGRARLLGLVPFVAGLLALGAIEPPDLMVSGDGRHVAVRSEDGRTYLLRGSDNFETRELLELSAISEEDKAAAVTELAQWPGARCNDDFCTLTLGSEETTLLVARNAGMPDYRALRDACVASDIVIAERALPESCAPRWIKLDGRELALRGGAVIDVSTRTVRHVRPAGDGHGW